MSLLVKKSFVPSYFDGLLNDNWLSDFGFDNRKCTPAVNVIENNDDFRIEVAAPGLSKNDFHINVENKVLTISSEKENKVEQNDGNYVRKEFSYNTFTRSFSLPDSVAEEKILATYNAGVLSIEIPKREEAKVKPAREIKIS